MGDEADADCARRWMKSKIEEAMLGGPPQKQRQTALRFRGRTFYTVELDDAGNEIKPPRPISDQFYCLIT